MLLRNFRQLMRGEQLVERLTDQPAPRPAQPSCRGFPGRTGSERRPDQQRPAQAPRAEQVFSFVFGHILCLADVARTSHRFTAVVPPVSVPAPTPAPSLARCRCGRSAAVGDRRRRGAHLWHNRHKYTQSDTARREDVAQGQSRAHQTGLHGWRSGLAPEAQRPGRADEVVVATHELDVVSELVCATGVAGRAPAQVGRGLPNCEVEALDEGCVQGL